MVISLKSSVKYAGKWLMILNDMVKRDLYIKKIRPYIDKPLIKGDYRS
jgi:hypothetical protein